MVVNILPPLTTQEEANDDATAAGPRAEFLEGGEVQEAATAKRLQCFADRACSGRHELLWSPYFAGRSELVR